jgi:HAD superfamily hydrolase (TIGR01490 family)
MPSKGKTKKVAIFDVDGTIFRSSLLIEVIETLVQMGVFPSEARRAYARAQKKWTDRQGTYEKYLFAMIDVYPKYIKGVKYDDYMEAVKKVGFFHKNRVYRYTRALVKKLKKEKYYLLAISGSPFELVHDFCQGWGFDKVYGRIFEVNKQGKFTGKVLFTDLIGDKAKTLMRAVKKEGLTLKDSYGIGDSETDIAIMKIVDNPVCFNPNRKLYAAAKTAGWKIVVERKDVVYNIDGSKK